MWDYLMNLLIFCFIVFLGQVANLEACSCYDRKELDKIEFAIKDYKKEAEKNYYWEVPLDPWASWRNLPREQWEYPYHERIQKLNNALLPQDVSRYPVIYHNILIYDQKIDVMSDYGYEKAYMNYFGPNMPWTPYSKEQKEAFVEKDRAKDRKYEEKTRNALDDLTVKVINIYLKLHEACLKEHVSLQTYRDYGLLAHLNNNIEISFDMLHRLMEEAEKMGELDLLDPKFYHELGSVCVEAMEYNKAIDYLSQSIQKDPQNKAAYFDRALAYFETGDFDLALDDYLVSDQSKKGPSHPSPISEEFVNALLTSTADGAVEAAIDFVPSLCGSVYGLGTALWAGAQHPVDSTQQFARACKEVSESIVECCKDIDWNTVDDCVDQVKILYQQYNQLSEKEKGQLIGSTIGKYGVDIFTGVVLFKGIKAYKNLRDANRMYNFKALATNKKLMMGLAAKHASKREAYLKSLRFNWDHQNKHIIGKHNYIEGRGIISIEPAELEAMTLKKAGTGQKIVGELGSHGYRERVDFGVVIGQYSEKPTPTSIPNYRDTKKGIIHYAKNGKIHVVPAEP